MDRHKLLSEGCYLVDDRGKTWHGRVVAQSDLMQSLVLFEYQVDLFHSEKRWVWEARLIPEVASES